MKTVMQMIIDEPEKLAEWLRGMADHLVAFDGYQGAGKSSVVRAMAKFLDIPACHLDDFVKPKQGNYFNSIDLQGLRVAFDRRPMLRGRLRPEGSTKPECYAGSAGLCKLSSAGTGHHFGRWSARRGGFGLSSDVRS